MGGKDRFWGGLWEKVLRIGLFNGARWGMMFHLRNGRNLKKTPPRIAFHLEIRVFFGCKQQLEPAPQLDETLSAACHFESRDRLLCKIRVGNIVTPWKLGIAANITLLSPINIMQKSYSLFFLVLCLALALSACSSSPIFIKQIQGSGEVIREERALPIFNKIVAVVILN